MPMMGTRAYARHRAERGLPGQTASAVSKAAIDGRIVRGPDGLIDSEAADESWRLNTADYGQAARVGRRAQPTAKVMPAAGRAHGAAERQQAAERCRGANWLARQICATARRRWPPYVRECWSATEPVFQGRLIGLLCDHLETWTSKNSSFKRSQAVTTGRSDVSFRSGKIPSGYDDFQMGARFLAIQVCAEARRTWPRLIEELFEPDPDRVQAQDSKGHLLALLLAHLEGWLAEHVAVTDLPAIEFASFGKDGSAIAAAYEAYRAEFAG